MLCMTPTLPRTIQARQGKAHGRMGVTRNGTSLQGKSNRLTAGDTEPVYNIKAVVQRTGVPADTVRAWERRYGIPLPQRTAGGQRAYSEHDITIIVWLRERTEEGITISQAVSLLHAIGEDVVTNAVPITRMPTVGARSPETVTADLLDAFLHYDQGAADTLVGEAFVLFGVEDVFLQIIRPALVEIGEKWHRAEIPTTVEHFASQFTKRKLLGLISMYDNRYAPWKIVIGCPPNEYHETGALILSLFMLRQGWQVLYLGPDVPVDDLVETVNTVQPDMVCVSATGMESAASIVQIGESLARIDGEHRPIFAYGGSIFNLLPELRARVAGVFLGEDASHAINAARALLIAR